MISAAITSGVVTGRRTKLRAIAAMPMALSGTHNRQFCTAVRQPQASAVPARMVPGAKESLEAGCIPSKVARSSRPRAGSVNRISAGSRART